MGWSEKSDSEKLAAFYAAVPASLLNYQEWLHVGWGAKNSGGILEDFIEWSKKDGRYNGERECGKKWDAGKKNHTIGTLMEIAEKYGLKDEVMAYYDGQGGGAAGVKLGWNDAIPTTEAKTAAKPPHCAPVAIEEPGGDWDQMRHMADYLEALFEDDEYVSYCVEAYKDEQKDGTIKWKPASAGISSHTAGELVAQLRKHSGNGDIHDVGAVINDYNKAAGVWIRVNPVKCGTGGDKAVSAYRHALVECDEIPVEEQLARYRALNLPCAAIVHSGGKSIHAVVKIDAKDMDEYKERVEKLYGICEAKGIRIDTQNKNAGRYSRLPGVMRGEHKQFLIETNCGAKSWDEWLDGLEKDEADSLDPIETLEEMKERVKNTPDNSLIGRGFLRRGGTVFLCAESGLGKSTLILQMMYHWTGGNDCFGFKPVKPLRILYVQNENDEHDILANSQSIEKAMEDEGKTFDTSSVIQWNLATAAGDAFVVLLSKRLEELKDKNIMVDLVVIDPALAYCGCDISKQKDTSHFFREGLNRIAKKYDIGLWIVHHENKPTKDALEGDKADKYACSGSSDITNFARGIVRLRRDGDYFRLVVAKNRKNRLENYPEEGKILEYDKGGLIYWREVSPFDLPIQPEKESREEAAMRWKAKELLRCLEPDSSYCRKDMIKILHDNAIEKNTNKKIELLNFMVKEKMLECSMDGSGTPRFLYWLPNSETKQN